MPICDPLFAGNQKLAEETAFRKSLLQGGYFILAARAVGLDCGPMSGFDQAKVNAEFFPDGKWKVNFLCNLGYGDPSKLFPTESASGICGGVPGAVRRSSETRQAAPLPS
jgi:3-hydroxypropanoate dehydrogenase